MFEKWNMKKVVLYLVAIMCVSFGIGFGILASTGWGGINIAGSKYSVKQEKTQAISVQGNQQNKGETNSGSAEVNQEKTSEAKMVKDINIEVTSADINIISEDRQDVKAVLTGNVSNKEGEPQLKMDLADGKLLISVKTKSIISFNFISNLQLNVYIPKNYENNLKVDASSAKVSIKDFKLKEYSCEVTSGDMTIENMTSDVISVKGSSGCLRGNNINTKTTSVKLTSGNITLDKFKGDLKGGCSSGNINVGYSEFNNNIDLSATSGNIKINLPAESEFYIDARATSGNVNCDFPITISGKQKDNHLCGTVKSDKNKITINVTSGNIRVQ